MTPGSISNVEGLSRATGPFSGTETTGDGVGVGVGAATGTGGTPPIAPFGTCVAGAPSPTIATITRTTTTSEE